MAQESNIKDCWDGNRCVLDEHCGKSGGICSSSLSWPKENNMNLTSELQGYVKVKKGKVVFLSRQFSKSAIRFDHRRF